MHGLAGSISVPLTCKEDWSECCNRWDSSKADSLHHATFWRDTETRVLRRHRVVNSVSQGMMFFPRNQGTCLSTRVSYRVRTLQLFAGNPCGMRISGEIMNLRYSYGGCENGRSRGCERGKNELFSHPRKNNVPHPCENNIFLCRPLFAWISCDYHDIRRVCRSSMPKRALYILRARYYNPVALVSTRALALLARPEFNWTMPRTSLKSLSTSVVPSVQLITCILSERRDQRVRSSFGHSGGIVLQGICLLRLLLISIVRNATVG